MDSNFLKGLKKLVAEGGLLPSEDENLGCSDEEIEQIMTHQNVGRLPTTYYEFLKTFGKHRKLMPPSVTATWPYVAELKEDGQEIISDMGIELVIPQDAFVFFMDEATYFWFFHTVQCEDDPQIFQWYEGYTKFEPIGQTFSEKLFKIIGGLRDWYLAQYK